MKTQVQRFSPHQNGKVIGILIAISSLVFVVPASLIGMIAAPKGAAPSIFIFLLFPFIYLIFGYIMVAVGCWFYNVMYPRIGGIEFEARSEDV